MDRESHGIYYKTPQIENKRGAEFIHAKYPQLHTTLVIAQAVRRAFLVGIRVPNEPTGKIENWFQVIESIHGSDDDLRKERLLRYYLEKNTIQLSDISQKYWNSLALREVARGRKADLIEIGVHVEEVMQDNGLSQENYHFPEEVKETEWNRIRES